MLDDERQGGKVRGPLHGIPILIKVCRQHVVCSLSLKVLQDSIDTPSLKVATTSGCYSLLGARVRQDAEIVRRVSSTLFQYQSFSLTGI